MIRNFLVIVFVLFSSYSFASISGKALYCKIFDEPGNNIRTSYDMHTAFAFHNDKFVQILFNFKNDKFNYGINYLGKFKSYENFIELWSSQGRGKIRFRLTPLKLERQKLYLMNNEDIISNCEKVDNFKKLKKKLDEIKLDLQSKYNKKLEKNKL